MKRLAALLLLCACVARGQVVQLSGGASTETNAMGGSATIYTQGLATQLNIGEINGALVGGASSNFDWRTWDVHLGDYPVSLFGGDLSLSDPVRGFVATKRSEEESLTVFGGLVGQSYSAPYFYGERAKQFGVGVSYFRRLHAGFESYLVGASASASHTALQSLRWHWRGVSASETTGMLESRFYFIGNGSLQMHHFSTAVNHQDYLWNGLHAVANNESASVFGAGFNGYASFFQSGTVTGTAVGAGWQNRIVTVRATQVLSKQDSFVGSVSETLTQKIHVTEFATRTNGQTTYNLGGGYTGNLVAFDVGYEQYFFPFALKAPFQKVLAVHITLQLPWHGMTVHGGTQANPTGGAKWTAYAGSYLQAPWSAGAPAMPQGNVNIKGFEVKGRVIDTHGDPISGAAIVVNGLTVYTSDDGVFMARLKKNVGVTVIVDVENFVAPGAWAVVSAPDSVSPGMPDLQIVVERKAAK